MNYTVFYSWQSDLDSKLNRSFIEDVLKRATKNISKDQSFELEAVVDRDTYGIGGSPSIVDSIMGKIAKSDIFMCDISIINSENNGRPTPNPNVLYELGYASAILGWDRIIMIQNMAYGSIEKLPFDLRGRRVLQYRLDSTVADKKECKEKLKLELFQILKSALSYYSTTYITKEKAIWWGRWHLESKFKMRGGYLHVFRVSSDAFLFNIRIFDGSRSGDVWGKADILTPNSACAKVVTGEDKSCEIIFRRRLENKQWWIEIEPGEICRMFHGLSTTFAGDYKHEAELIIDQGFLDEIDMNVIERMVGRYLPMFLENFQYFSEGENLDSDLDFKVIVGAVKGLYTTMESIAVKDNKGNIWCSFLDPDENVIRSFSNTHLESNSITKWVEGFSDKKHIINNDNDQYSFY